jgi:hypothetical protein
LHATVCGWGRAWLPVTAFPGWMIDEHHHAGPDLNSFLSFVLSFHCVLHLLLCLAKPVIHLVLLWPLSRRLSSPIFYMSHHLFFCHSGKFDLASCQILTINLCKATSVLPYYLSLYHLDIIHHSTILYSVSTLDLARLHQSNDYYHGHP